MSETLAMRFKASTIFAIDLVDVLASNVEDQRRLQEKRAWELLWAALTKCLTDNEARFGQWVDEADRIKERMKLAERKRGKAVWQHRFLRLHAPLLLVNHNYGLMVSNHNFRDGTNLDASNARYRSAFLQDVNYRITREGALVATYEVDFRAKTYEIPEVITSLENLREDSFATLVQFLTEYFGDAARRRLLGEATEITFRDRPDITRDSIAEAAHFHSLVVIEGFCGNSGGTLTPLSMGDVVNSRGLAGILNEAHWYLDYSDNYCQSIGAKQFGYRADEIYLIERRTTVLVAGRCWKEDPLIHYRQDLQLVIEHHVAAIALLMQQLSFFREYSEVRVIENHDPLPVLPLVLASRSNLALLNESLDFTALVRHGFTRVFARRLRSEMELDKALMSLTQRVSDMSEAISLKSSVQSANAALARAKRSYVLQAIAVLLSVVALVVSITIALD